MKIIDKKKALVFFLVFPPSFSDLLMFARLIEGLDQHNIRVLPSMKITLIYSRQDIPTKWESWEISHKSFGNSISERFITCAGLFHFSGICYIEYCQGF